MATIQVEIPELTADEIRSRAEIAGYERIEDFIADFIVGLESQTRENIAGKIRQGLDSLRAGRVVDGESVFERIYAELDRLD